MPYIKQEERKYLEPIVKQASSQIENCGQLNFAITIIIQEYLKKKGQNYANINEVVGVLECAKLEFYRRVAIPYEDEKIKENGDVQINL